MADKYSIDPNFVVPEPTAADFFCFFTLEEYTPAKSQKVIDGWREDGVKQCRLTVVSDEHPHDLYPEGYWLEGWTDENARMLPFGGAHPDDGTISPPLVAVDAEQPQ